MRCLLVRGLGLALSLLMLCFATVCAARPDDPPAGPGAAAAAAAAATAGEAFRLNITSQVSLALSGQSQQMDGDSTLAYRLTRHDREVTLSFDWLRSRISRNGMPEVNATLSRSGIVQHGRETDEPTPYAEAAPEVQAMLRDAFGGPVARIEVSPWGEDLRRTVVAGPGAGELLAQGLIGQARLFHVMFPPENGKWLAAVEMNVGSGGVVRGSLLYEKVLPGGAPGSAAAPAAGGAPAPALAYAPGTAAGGTPAPGTPAAEPSLPPGQVLVRVSGTLLDEAYQDPVSKLTYRNARYVVKGEQTYDLRRGEWVAGALDITLQMQLEQDGERVGSAYGTMRMTLETGG